MIAKLSRYRLFFAILFMGLVAGGVAFSKDILFVEDKLQRASAIVLLGGGSGDRALRAAELFRQGWAPEVLVVGSGDCQHNLRRLVPSGVPPARVMLECASRNTKENAALSVPLIRQQRWRKVILVTSWYHSRRALAVFRSEAPEVEWISAPSYSGGIDMTRKPAFTEIGTVMLEYVKLGWYTLRYGVVASRGESEAPLTHPQLPH